MKKSLSILYTGGTFGMQATESGLAPAQNLGAQIAPLLQDFEEKGLTWDLTVLEPLLDSANMQFKHWIQIADQVLALQESDAVLIIHGTDTMAYSASALSFLLHQRATKPVILTGSQYPIGQDGSDAQVNFQQAVEHGLSCQSGIYISFADALIPGPRGAKVDANGLAAFAAPKGRTMQVASTAIGFDFTQTKRPIEDINIPIIRVTPALNARQIKAITAQRPDALLLEVYGVGTLPDQNAPLLKALKKANKAGILILAVTQCSAGALDFGVYQTGQALHQIGAVNGRDMTTEAALAKLTVLFYLGYPLAMIRTLLARNICGEMSHEAGHE